MSPSPRHGDSAHRAGFVPRRPSCPRPCGRLPPACPWGQREAGALPGIAVTRHERGHPVREDWLPVGTDEPTDADDETLIAALRTAWLWSRPAA
ncbi:hypothetical protein CFP75_40130 [Amycolatopsis alba DSM 44262]|uniref:Uncharacterized protein n=1 Tax=Amycolatopsis alba DSM 44262 TaxID=1125972 RepID=A0A229R9E4_AMYAL|nr:hypothetical protein CFP75_40130 [Amycolatopsis alba DSM 44262]